MKVSEQAVDHLELEPWTNKECGPDPTRTCPPSTAAVSSVRVTVVPTAVIEEPRALAAAIAAAVCSGILNHSLCNLPRSRSSERRFFERPRSHVERHRVDLHPLAFSSSKRVVARCKLAVGAATAPGSSANTVWYRSSSSEVAGRLM